MWKVAFAQQRLRRPDRRIGQPFERAFHPPFGHRLARVLARIEPDLLGARADRQAIDRAGRRALAEFAVRHAGLGAIRATRSWCRSIV